MHIGTIDEGSTVRILSVKGAKEFSCRLLDLGFISRERVKVVKNKGNGPLVLEIKNTRIGLGRKEAKYVIVS